MEVNVRTVVDAAMQLPATDRLEIASKLLETVAPDDGLFHFDDPALLAELDRRAADEDIGIPWHELRNETP